jgi:hypothetical protein
VYTQEPFDYPPIASPLSTLEMPNEIAVSAPPASSLAAPEAVRWRRAWIASDAGARDGEVHGADDGRSETAEIRRRDGQLGAGANHERAKPCGVSTTCSPGRKGA